MSFDQLYKELVDCEDLKDIPIATMMKVVINMLKILDSHDFLKFEEE